MPQASYTTSETLQTLCHLAERDMLKSNKKCFPASDNCCLFTRKSSNLLNNHHTTVRVMDDL